LQNSQEPNQGCEKTFKATELANSAKKAEGRSILHTVKDQDGSVALKNPRMLKPSIVLSKLLSGEKVPRIRTRNSN
jgi:hypothetical protein